MNCLRTPGQQCLVDMSIPMLSDVLHPPCTTALDARRARPRPKNIILTIAERERDRE